MSSMGIFAIGCIIMALPASVTMIAVESLANAGKASETVYSYVMAIGNLILLAAGFWMIVFFWLIWSC